RRLTDHKLVGKSRRQPGQALRGGAPPDNDGRPGLLLRLGGEMGVSQMVVPTIVAEWILAPKTGDHLELFCDRVHASCWRRIVDAVRLVFELQPAGADPQLSPSVAQLVEGCDHLRQHHWMAKGDGTDQSTKSD